MIHIISLEYAQMHFKDVININPIHPIALV